MTLKRYYSQTKPIFHSKEEMEKWDSFDAKLTHEDIQAAQTFDADCNDCIYFQRGKMTNGIGFKMFEGVCGLDNSKTTAYPMQFRGLHCFVHRKTINTSNSMKTN